MDALGRTRLRSLPRIAVLVTVVYLCVGSAPQMAAAAVSGSQVWESRYAWAGNDRATAMASGPDGSEVFVTGYSTGSTTGVDFATASYDTSTGATLWVRRYNRLEGSNDFANALGVSPDGSAVFVTGTSEGNDGADPDYVTVAYEASTGDMLWATRYAGPGGDRDTPTALEVSPDGTEIFVTGPSIGRRGDEDYATVAYDTATGSQSWVRRHDGRGEGDDWPNALGVSADGSQVFVTGSSDGSILHRNTEYATLAYDTATGARSWIQRYKGPGDRSDAAIDLAVSHDGSEVIVTGQGAGPEPSGANYATVAYAALTGVKLWVKRYNGPGDGADRALAVRLSPNDSVVAVTGESDGTSGRSDYATVAYDASTGARLWSQRYDGASHLYDRAVAIGISSDGSQVFVTGSSTESYFNTEYATLAYDAATGAELWIAHYQGPGRRSDAPADLAASPEGLGVFVTGASLGPRSNYDFATVAYASG